MSGFQKLPSISLKTMVQPKKMAHMNSASYDKLRCASRGKFSIQQFLRLKELAANTVGVNNSIFRHRIKQFTYLVQLSLQGNQNP